MLMAADEARAKTATTTAAGETPLMSECTETCHLLWNKMRADVIRHVGLPMSRCRKKTAVTTIAGAAASATTIANQTPLATIATPIHRL